MVHSLKNFIDKNLYYLVHLKKMFTRNFHKTYYSQSGEDIVVSEIFKKKKDGYYVDVGSFHPVHYSNTYLYYKRGWSGINIDPNPRSIKLFNIYRKRDINLNIGISGISEKKKYYMFNHASCNTFSEEQKDTMIKKSYIKLIGEESIQCEPLSDILQQYSKKPIDLLSIDTEGFDLNVLKSNNWEKYRPHVIIVENTEFDLDHAGSDPIYTYLKSKNYTLYAKTGLSLIFKSNDR